FETVHGGHEDVRDDQLRFCRCHDLERLSSVACLECQMPIVTEKRDDQFTVLGVIVDHQYASHVSNLVTCCNASNASSIAPQGAELQRGDRLYPSESRATTRAMCVTACALR